MRSILFPAALATLAALAHAQCYETNLGSLMPRGVTVSNWGYGDDVFFDLQPLGFAFPMAGTTAGTYTHIHVQANGVMFLTNGTASGATTTGYSTSTTTMLNNLRGTAGQPPRIALYWRDLNNLVANGGGVFFNNTIPGKFVVTWKNTVLFGQTQRFTIQAQIFSSGRVVFFYNLDTPVANAIIVGLSPGNAVATTSATDLCPGPNNSTGTLIYETFTTTSGNWDLPGNALTFAPDVFGGYLQGCMHCGSNRTSYGSGCYNQTVSFYEEFPAGGADLANGGLRASLNGQGGYDVQPAVLSWYTPTSANLGLTDDSVSLQNLPFNFPYPGGSTNQIQVCSNGYLWLDPSQTGADFSPTVAELLAQAARIAPHWCDLNPAAAGTVTAEVDGADFVVTFDQVQQWNVPGNLCTFQIRLKANGTFEVGYQGLTNANTTIVGASPVLNAANPGPRDLSTASFSTAFPDRTPLSLSASGAPVTGGTVSLITAGIPAEGIMTASILSFTSHNPGIELSGMGMPGCYQLVGLDVAHILFGGPSVTNNVTVPNDPSWVGVHVYTQSSCLVPGINALGGITSNALDLLIGNV